MNQKLIMLLLGLTMFGVTLATHIYTPLLPQVQQVLGTSYFLVYLTVTIFMITLAAMQLVFGPIADRWGRRIVFLPCLLLFTLASFGCAFSNSIELLLFFRFLQGIGAAGVPVVATTLIGDLFQGNERAKAMSMFQMIFMLGPAVGPLIGGFVGARTGYLGVFMLLGFFGALLWIINVNLIPETKMRETSQITFNFSNYFSILQNRMAQAAMFLGFTNAFTMFTILVFLPALLTNSFGFNPEQIGSQGK